MKPIIIICLLPIIFSCKKSSKRQCPLQTYSVICQESYPDLEFPGYLTGTNTYVIESNCLEDAIEKAGEMSYEAGQIYKRCQVSQ